jgi:anti-sigma regulatory factor (Ser/Thr protein kinase)
VRCAERNGLNMPQLNALASVPSPAIICVTTITYPGALASVPAARHSVRELLCHSPRAGDAELIAAELMSNAVLHTPSGGEGGTFTITVRHAAGWARIEVLDLGETKWYGVLDDGPSVGRVLAPGFAESGRGLRMVAAVADDCGHAHSGAKGQTSWATVTW